MINTHDFPFCENLWRTETSMDKMQFIFFYYSSTSDCVCVCVCSFTQLCLTVCNSMDCNSPDSSVHGIFQARKLKWIDISYSRVSSWSRVWTCVSCIFCICRQNVYHWYSWEATSDNIFCKYMVVRTCIEW